MKGLLYKDFVAVKGKWISLGILTVFILFTVLRFLFPGTEAGTTMTIENANGELGASYGELYDTLLYFFYNLISCVMVISPLFFVKYIFGQDEKSKSKVYMNSLPVSKKDIVAEKYVLYLIFYYVISNVCILMAMVYNVTASYQDMIEKVQMQQVLVIGMASVMLLVHAIQFPTYIIKGVKKAEERDTIIIMAIMFSLLAIFLFVPLDYINIPAYIEKYKYEIAMVESWAFGVTLLLYFLSYQYTLKYYDVGEVNDYE